MPPDRYLRRISSGENGSVAPSASHGPSSSSTTSRPASASMHAVIAPPGPEPITSTSAIVSGVGGMSLLVPSEDGEALVEADQIAHGAHPRDTPALQGSPAVGMLERVERTTPGDQRRGVEPDGRPLERRAEVVGQPRVLRQHA